MPIPSPPKSAAHLSLGMTHIGSVLDKLRWEIRQHIALSEVHYGGYSSDPLDAKGAVFTAINAAGTAWSLIEWAEHDLENEGRNHALRSFAGLDLGADLTKVKYAIRRSSETINHCYHITHAVKHARLSRMDSGITAGLHFNLYARDGEPSIRISGVVATKREEVHAQMTIHTVLVDALLWGESFARALGLRTQE